MHTCPFVHVAPTHPRPILALSIRYTSQPYTHTPHPVHVVLTPHTPTPDPVHVVLTPHTPHPRPRARRPHTFNVAARQRGRGEAASPLTDFPITLDIRRTMWWRKWQMDLHTLVPAVVEQALRGANNRAHSSYRRYTPWG
jgi:hypothetical protein